MPGKRDLPAVGSRSKKGGCGMPSCDGKAREQFVCPCRKHQYCTRQCLDYYQLQHGSDCAASVDREKDRLWNAAKLGDISLIRLLLSAEIVTIDSAKEDGMTPLCLSAQQGHLHAVQFLLREGANLACSQKAIQCAQGNQEIIDAILDEPRRRAEGVAAKKPVAKASEKPPQGAAKTGSGLSLPPPLHVSSAAKGEKKAGAGAGVGVGGTDSGGRGEDGKFNKTKTAGGLSVISTLKKPIITFQPERGTDSKSTSAPDNDKSSPETEEEGGVDGEAASGDSGGDSEEDAESEHEEPPPPVEEAVTLPPHCKWGQTQGPPAQPPSQSNSHSNPQSNHQSNHQSNSHSNPQSNPQSNSEIRDTNPNAQVLSDESRSTAVRRSTEEKLLVCPVCTYHNPSTFLICGACDTKFDQDVAVVYVNARVAAPTAPAATSFSAPPPLSAVSHPSPLTSVSHPPPLTTVRERGPPAIPTGPIDHSTSLPPGLGLGLGHLQNTPPGMGPPSQISSQMSSQNQQAHAWGQPSQPLSQSSHINQSNQPSAHANTSSSTSSYDSHGYASTPSQFSQGYNGHQQIPTQQVATESSSLLLDKVASLEIEVAGLKAQSLINELEMADLKAQGVRDAETIAGLNRRLQWLDQQLQQGSAWMSGLSKQYNDDERGDHVDNHAQGSSVAPIVRSQRVAGPR